jgi:hypothetical protein
MGNGLLAALFGINSGPEVLITNNTNDSAVVFIDGEQVGKVRAGKSKGFDAERGLHMVELQNSKEEVLELTTLQVRNSGAELTLQRPRGVVEFTNTSGVTLAIRVDGKKRVDLRDGETQILELPAGEHKIRALYPYLGTKKSLASSTVSVVNDMMTGVSYGPDDNGWIRIDNRLGSWANVKVNGSLIQRVAKGEEVDIKMPLGKSNVSFWRNGEQIDSASFTVEPFSENRMQLSQSGRNFIMRDGVYTFY